MKIVVGTDGSPNATVALRWAAEEAAIHDASIEVLLVWNFLDQYHVEAPEAFDPDYTEDSARAALAAWVGGALGASVGVEQRVACDLPATALLEASDAADLLVLGARGRGGFEGMLLGSVSDRVAHLATRPVAVVREAAQVRKGRVVVGIDGSVRSFDALRWAAGEALARDADLDVVHAWRMPILAASPVVSAFPDLATMEAVGREILERALADPALVGVRVKPHIANDNPAHALMTRSAGAGLLVVGSRGFRPGDGCALGIGEPADAAPLTLSSGGCLIAGRATMNQKRKAAEAVGYRSAPLRSSSRRRRAAGPAATPCLVEPLVLEPERGSKRHDDGGDAGLGLTDRLSEVQAPVEPACGIDELPAAGEGSRAPQPWVATAPRSSATAASGSSRRSRRTCQRTAESPSAATR